jgi:hypothetical protein
MQTKNSIFVYGMEWGNEESLWYYDFGDSDWLIVSATRRLASWLTSGRGLRLIFALRFFGDCFFMRPACHDREKTHKGESETEALPNCYDLDCP